MAQCNEISLLLGTFDDGELEPHEMQEVARHLATCPSCETALAETTALGRLLRDAAPQPSLDGFAAAVQSRIARLPRPIGVRIRGYVQQFNERLVAAIAVSAATAAAAVVTAFLLTPVARNYVASHGTQQIASLVNQGERSANDVVASAVHNSQAVISRLESPSQAVAVWSEPTDGTTVIWVPDQDQP